MNFRNRVTSALALLVLAGSLAACGSDGDAGAEDQTLTVYAAASLTETFTTLGKKFESEHPDVTVRFSFGGSSDLVAQLQQGAPADVFASADVPNMQKLLADDLAGMLPLDFARNTLEIVTPADNPARIRTLRDLAAEDVALVVCAPQVPCGRAAATVARTAGLTFTPASEEQSVKDVLAKVAAGEADAGLVYVTDARAAGATVTGITFPESAAAVNVYPITTLRTGTHDGLARQFVDYVLSPAGQAVLAAAGFAAPR